MSFARPSLGLRLALWYAGFFAVGAGLVLGISYSLTARALWSRDRAAISDKLSELEAEYRDGGWKGVAQAAAESRGRYVVRLCLPDGATSQLEMPNAVEGFDAAALSAAPCPASGWTRLTSTQSDVHLDLAAAALADGSRLQVGLADAEREDLMERLRSIAFLTLIPTFLLAGGAGYVMARRALAQNDALMAGLRRSLDDIAHDLRTPAARLRGAAEAALSVPPDSGNDRAALAECVEESQRVCATLDTLMDLAEAESGAARAKREEFDARILLKESAELYRLGAEETGRTLDLDCPVNLIVRGDAARLRRILANLLDNALKYGGASGRILLRGRVEGGWLDIRVEDEGPGIAAGDLPHIFERLYRAERDRSKAGLGVGLSLARALAESQGGTVRAENLPARGARFIARLPAA